MRAPSVAASSTTGAAVDLQHLAFRGEGRACQSAGGAEARGGDQEADVAVGRLLGQPRGRGRVGQVVRSDLGADPVPSRDVVGELAQCGRPPGDEHDVEPAAGGLPRERTADAGRRAGDERGGAVAVGERGSGHGDSHSGGEAAAEGEQQAG